MVDAAANGGGVTPRFRTGPTADGGIGTGGDVVVAAGDSSIWRADRIGVAGDDPTETAISMTGTEDQIVRSCPSQAGGAQGFVVADDQVAVSVPLGEGRINRRGIAGVTIGGAEAVHE